jgi:hypothetical protein
MRGKQLKKRVIKKQDRIALRITLLFFWFLAGLYIGIAGWAKIHANELKRQAVEAYLKVDCSDVDSHFEYKGLSYCTLEDIAVQEYLDNVGNLQLGWIFYLPDPIPLLLTIFAFGAVGSTVRLIRIIIGTQKLSSLYTLSLSPALGGMTALMLLGVSYLAPYLFSNSKIVLNPTVVPFLGLFAGAFSEHVQRWFQTVLDKFFGMQKEKADVT